jgi:hypothetical protein
MLEPKEFSFGRFVRFATGIVLIAAAFVALSLGVGFLFAPTAQDTANARTFVIEQTGGKIVNEDTALVGTNATFLVCVDGRVKEVSVESGWHGYSVQYARDLPKEISCSVD